MYGLIMTGTSWGGLAALSRLLNGLRNDVHQPIVVAQHRSAEAEDRALGRLLQHHTRRLVSDPDDKTTLESGHMYLVPPDYHVQRVMPDAAIGIVLTGANNDGAADEVAA